MINSKVKFFHTQVNLQNENEIKQWIKNIITTYGKIDYLINNAALHLPPSQLY